MAENNENVPPTGRSDVEIKNLLIDLVRENLLIYDKSHPDHFRANISPQRIHCEQKVSYNLYFNI